MALNIDTQGLRRSGELVNTAGTLLEPALGDDVPPCGGDEVSQAVIANLNAWQRWLIAQVRGGIQQAFNAAAGIGETAAAYEAEDLAAAATYAAGGHSAPVPPDAAHYPPHGRTAATPSGPPARAAIPDISGQEGEQLALALESGAGPGPALAAAARLNGLAAQATAAQAELTAAQTQLLAAGQAAPTGPLMIRLTRAIHWTQAVAGHASALAAGYTTAAESHTATKTAVGHPAVWRATKAGYTQAVVEQQLTGLAGPKVHAYRVRLAGMQTQAGTAATGHRAAGYTATTLPGPLPNPGLDPNAPSPPGPTPDDAIHKSDDKDPKAPPEDTGGLREMLGPLMGAFGPLMHSLGQANPLQSLGQIGQQAGGLAHAVKPSSAPVKPAALATGHPGGAHKGGGGSGLKPAASPSGALRPASLTGTPASSPAATPIKPVTPTAGAAARPGGGMGVMPMGQHRESSTKVNSYEKPLPEVENRGRPGVVGDIAKPKPLVKPESQNAVKARLAARKKDISPTNDA